MHSRRDFIGRSLGLAALATLDPRRLAGATTPFTPQASAHSPIRIIPSSPQSIMVDGMPFAEGFTGDHFSNDEIPFHGSPGCDRESAASVEETDIVVVGGGISGLATAYLLREHRPIVLELRDRFGGVAQGERWSGTNYSLGNAYVISPDAGSFLLHLYHELGLLDVVRVDDAQPHIELQGEILDRFFDPGQHPVHIRQAFAKYREVVTHMANESYPDIPLPKAGGDWIVDLDRRTLREDIEERMDMPIPTQLRSAIQAYCYSSFAAGWEEISAAGGWNFLAAEEFGRWVFPGGNAFMARALWRRLETELGGERTPRLRPESRVTSVELTDDDRVEVTYLDADGTCRCIRAKKVAMCCPKFLCNYIIKDLGRVAPWKVDAIHQLDYRAYVVANVLIDHPIDLDFYDVFLLGDGRLPEDEGKAGEWSRVVDMLNGHFVIGPSAEKTVLTLYWPLPFPFGRWTLLIETAWQDYAASLVPQIRNMLDLLRVPHRAVEQVRMTRWGHALPISRPGLMASGVLDAVQRPLDDRIYFINQDNWALPAIENCLLDAEIYVPQIADGL